MEKVSSLEVHFDAPFCSFAVMFTAVKQVELPGAKAPTEEDEPSHCWTSALEKLV